MRTLPLSINPEDRILIVAPHPDDESIGVGGLIAAYPEQCEIVVMTDGKYGNTKYTPEKMKTIRRIEFEAAMNVAGVKSYMFFDVEDGRLISNRNAFDEMDLKKYTHVFLPNPNDNHSDHTACFVYVMEKIRSKGDTKIQVFQYEVHNPIADVNYHLDITESADKKQKMVECHNSQMETHPYGKQVRSLAEYRGFQNEKPGRLLEVYAKVEAEKQGNVSTGVEIELAKYKWFTRCLTDWMELNNKVGGIEGWFLDNGYKDIAIYGFGVLGKILYRELRETTCSVRYIIDKNISATIDNINVCNDIVALNNVDIVVVTVAYGYEEISKELQKKCALPSISLDEILMGIRKETI